MKARMMATKTMPGAEECHKDAPHYSHQVGGMENDTGGPLSSGKAREILHDGTVHGKPITKKQRGFFGAVASGKVRK